MRILRAIASSQSLNRSDDLSSFFKPRFYQRVVHQMRDEGICGYHDVAAGHQHLHQTACKLSKKTPKSIFVVRPENGESWQRTALAAVE